MRHNPLPVIFLFALNLFLMTQVTLFAQHANPSEKAMTHVNQNPRAPRQPGFSIAELVRITQPIAVATEFPDGKKQLNLGNGFIIGSRYFTVHHNLTPIGSFALSANIPSYPQIAYLDGIPLTLSFVNVEQDVAIFDLPDDMCVKYCNDFFLNQVPTLEPGQEVIWVKKSGSDFTLKAGRILNYAYLGDVADSPGFRKTENCDANLIVEVDTAFPRGSSGAPLLDARTGHIVGIIQGTLGGKTRSSGYFKPINCVTRLVQIDFN